MSRIGNKLIPIVEGVTVSVNGNVVDVKGAKGEDHIKFDSSIISVEIKDGNIQVSRSNDEKHTKQLHGTTRALINNAVVGCHEGFVKLLDLVGIGFKASVKGDSVILNVGYTHPVTIQALPGVKLAIVDNRIKDVSCTVEVSGSDKFAVGQTAALIRDTRRPEPYLGKGIRYRGEQILHKEGKRAAAGGSTGKK